jgi:two-component system sensor histidine kinase VicK
MICVIQDITEHKKLEEMQKEFVANVSHELRTPLTTIKSYTETLLNGAMEEPEIAENFLNVINNEGDRMTALVQDLLDLSRLDNKQTTFIMEELNLNLLLEDSIEKYSIHVKKKKQTLAYIPARKAHKVLGDANRIEQVIKNIISNAVKYSGEETTINVSIFEQNENVIIKVEDSGFGIPEEDLPRIFERFYRVDKARSREMGGTGLGLAIAKEIMEYHGGHISVESQLGRGTTFMLHFPKVSVSK